MVNDYGYRLIVIFKHVKGSPESYNYLLILTDWWHSQQEISNLDNEVGNSLLMTQSQQEM
jgi:hypothetical protein